MNKLIIRWQRLVDNSTTCPRCSGTEIEIEKAIYKLKEAFKPLNIYVVLEKYELNQDEFRKSPLVSNLILINDKPLEDWLNAEIGRSQCCSICGDEDCRTIQFKGQTYEAIPENLIIKASLIAAAELITTNTKIHLLNINNKFL